MSERLGQYELVRHLATGGMAEIFIARQSGPAGFDRELAIKRILPHLAREDRFISMFLDEARIAARLQHPNIVQIYELGEESGEYFIAMEYIAGGDLADLLDKAEERGVEIPIAMSVRIISDVLAALDYAHDFSEDGKPLRIVHRDVSPHNVLIGHDGMIKLVDFGIAHAVERHAKTETGLVKGKLSYMAPEQVEQRGVDRRADIFSAGALLYELLTGAPPFGRELAAINAILNSDPPSPQENRPDVPDELVDVVFKALAKDPDDRFQSAQEMLEALEAVLRAFDKYVSPKHVAQFADALLNDLEIVDFEDVSQAIPRVASSDLMHVLKPSDNSAETVEDMGAPSSLPVRENEYAPTHGLPTGWYAAGAGVLLAIGLGVVVLQASLKPDADVPEAVAQEPPREPATPQPGEDLVAEPAEADDGVIELDEQLVVDDEGEWEDDGFTFDREESELAELEGWVETLQPEQVDRMLAANFGRDDGEYLWSVRGARLAEEFGSTVEAVNPGDPRAPKLLGLEDLDEEVLRPKKRKSTRKRRTRRKPKRKSTAKKSASRKVSKKPAEPAKQAENKPAHADKKVSVKKPPKKKAPKKTDLQIIDTAVPY